MYILEAVRREPGINAKKLKRSGMIPGSIYGGNLEGSLLIQIHQNEVKQLLKTKNTGNKVTLLLEGSKYIALIKEIGRSPLGNQIEHISFQSLVNSEIVTSAARIVLRNKDKVSNFIQQRLFEIPYRAFPLNLVEDVVIDLEGLPAGTYLRVEDLDIARNEAIELLIDPEGLVLSIVGSRKPIY